MNYNVKVSNFGTCFGFVDFGQLFLDENGTPYIKTNMVYDEENNGFNAVKLSEGEFKLFDIDDHVWIPTKYDLKIEM